MVSRLRAGLLSAFPFLAMGVVGAVDLTGGPGIGLLPMMALGPAFAGLTGGKRRTALVGALAMALSIALSFYNDQLGERRGNATLISVAGVSIAALLATAMRQKREAELANVRSIAEAAQRVLLRPVPRGAGRLRVAVSYTSAVAEARIGGDLYEVVTSPYGVRLIVGDVQGKGLEAVETAAVVLGAFREAAYDEPDLLAVGERLERALSRHLLGEKFVTAVLVEVREEGRAAGAVGVREGGVRGEVVGAGVVGAEVVGAAVEVAREEGSLMAGRLLEGSPGGSGGRTETATLLNFGHPAPLAVRHDGSVHFAEPPQRCLPLGLGLHGIEPPKPHQVPFAPGDQLLFYTDGVTEARDADNQFYPLDQRAHLLKDPDPEGALEAVRQDIQEHVRSPLNDDAAMLLLRYRDVGLLPALGEAGEADVFVRE
ncbi:serine/threonine-protein phosphatase [Streptomyces sp. NBC_01795]|uniref:PP2C family protein-serine/threonine phosphatase n=1 Tax=Streptomyces sp. NBC_01795 TaxID=2975943 RepID=UPI002DDBD9F2|nr:PP2C family protein-serine/threonine phosphatase [Streptomyces sp. NBC_01795]WSA93723.1 serine/threonine-protein phosphatase [Streptomyces sp. NBC_01795]